MGTEVKPITTTAPISITAGAGVQMAVGDVYKYNGECREIVSTWGAQYACTGSGESCWSGIDNSKSNLVACPEPGEGTIKVAGQPLSSESAFVMMEKSRHVCAIEAGLEDTTGEGGTPAACLQSKK